MSDGGAARLGGVASVSALEFLRSEASLGPVLRQVLDQGR
jgi:hypothetical protein